MTTLNFVNFKNMVEAINSDIDTEEADYQALLSETDVRGRGYIEAAIQFIQGTTEYRRGLAKAKEALATIRHLNGRVGGNKTAGGTFRESASVAAPVAKTAVKPVAKADLVKSETSPVSARATAGAEKVCKKAEQVLAYLAKDNEWDSQAVIRNAVGGTIYVVRTALAFLQEKGLVTTELKNKNPAHKHASNSYNRSGVYYSLAGDGVLQNEEPGASVPVPPSATAGVRLANGCSSRDFSNSVLNALKIVKTPPMTRLMKMTGHDYYTIKRTLNALLASGQIVQVEARGKNHALYASWRIADGHA
jgi:hypothetical protein